jgi:hypothetical protein
MERLDYILQRIEEKKGDYQRYDLSPAETAAFNTFFDLAQELDSIKDFHELCVAIPKGFFGLDAWFYLINPRDGSFMLVSQRHAGCSRARRASAGDGKCFLLHRPRQHGPAHTGKTTPP